MSHQIIAKFNKFCDTNNYSHVWFKIKNIQINSKIKVYKISAYVVSKGSSLNKLKLFSCQREWNITDDKSNCKELSLLLIELKQFMKHDSFREILINKELLKNKTCVCKFISFKDLESKYNISHPNSFIIKDESCVCNIDRNECLNKFIEKNIKH